MQNARERPFGLFLGKMKHERCFAGTKIKKKPAAELGNTAAGRFRLGKWEGKEGSSGGRTRTCDLRVMSPTSYRLLYPAMFWCKVKVL